ncbi:MAG: 50S ribosomal protein L14e [Candidatus Aenigmarchaeota archaeon]|nr:50S ribosomal protein L14e [Candidatus Aenigmarchaeota archaeon]MCX8190781.1 50S ribosomal protein L14e [Candidatus Aenigmarchaeota archaeon]MDW8160028.1 50S ribosomal protein L14e [Candidatus Aenigmarchaeota archaeon]
MIEVGRICVKLSGREKGRYCVVLKKIDKNFVLVSGPKILTGVKRRRVNLIHLQPTKYKLEIKEEADDKELLEAWRKSNLIEVLGLKLPSGISLKEENKEEKKESK